MPDTKSIKVWGESVLKLAELAAHVDELEARAAEAERVCAASEKTIGDMVNARARAEAEHKEWLAQLARDAETHRQSTMNKHARMVGEHDKEIGVLAARRDKLMVEVQGLVKQKDALVDEEAKLRESIASMKKYLKQAGALVESL